MKPIIAIVGRPNVGKSTLFNRLTSNRNAIVQDMPGVTRDRQYGDAEILGRNVIVIDTGGLEPIANDAMFRAMREQADIAMEEADAIICVFDGPAGVVPQDNDVVRMLQRSNKPVFWVVNKIDGPKHDAMVADFYELGIGPLFPMSAQHAGGVYDLMEAIFESLPEEEEEILDVEDGTIRVAIVGRPNVGKSTLLNRLLGEERVIVSNEPGTTRDSIDTPFEVTRPDGTIQKYLLIDTAGVRRRKWIRTSVEKISIVRTFKSIDRAHVCIFVLDATEKVSDQDARLAGLISDKGRACVILLNKWDAVAEKDNKTFGEHIKHVQDELEFFKWAPINTISGLSGQRTQRILPMVDEAYANYRRRVGTGELNRAFDAIIHKHQPPIHKGRRLKFYYATQVKSGPPVFVLWCNDPDALHFSYRRFLTNRFREYWDFSGTPIRVMARLRNRRSAPPEGLPAKRRELAEMLAAPGGPEDNLDDRFDWKGVDWDDEEAVRAALGDEDFEDDDDDKWKETDKELDDDGGEWDDLDDE